MTLTEWKSFSITQEIMGELKLRQQWLKEQLAEQAGRDPIADSVKVGAIKAYQDILDIQLADEETQ